MLYFLTTKVKSRSRRAQVIETYWDRPIFYLEQFELENSVDDMLSQGVVHVYITFPFVIHAFALFFVLYHNPHRHAPWSLVRNVNEEV